MNKHAYLLELDGILVDSLTTYASAVLRILDENGGSCGSDIVKILTPPGLTGATDYYIYDFSKLPDMAF